MNVCRFCGKPVGADYHICDPVDVMRQRQHVPSALMQRNSTTSAPDPSGTEANAGSDMRVYEALRKLSK